MAVLTVSEMPASFTGQSLFWASRTSQLNRFRKRNEQGRFEDFALLIYGIGTAIICAPLGVAYHGLSALGNKTISLVSAPHFRERFDALCWEHFKAMATDIMGIAWAAFFCFHKEFDRNEAIGMWFSSTEVRTEYAGPLPPPINALSAELYWGRERVGLHQCSYDKMRIYAVRHWEEQGVNRPLNDVQLLRKICSREFEGWPHQSDFRLTFPNVKPLFLAPSTIFAKGEETPQYEWPDWQTVAMIGACAIGLICCMGMSSTLAIAAPFLFQAKAAPLLILPVALTALAGAVFYGRAALAIYEGLTLAPSDVLAPAELALFHNMIARDNFSPRAALFWLKKAASRGHRDAQKMLGVILFAAAFERREEKDPEALEILGEGVSWLQEAGINGNESARALFRGLFEPSPDRLFRGVSGVTKEERLRSFLQGCRPANLEQLVASFKQIGTPAAREKLWNGVWPREAIAASVEERLLPEIAGIVLDYYPAFGFESPFFTEEAPAARA
jgi:hypothetical protein